MRGEPGNYIGDETRVGPKGDTGEDGLPGFPGLNGPKGFQGKVCDDVLREHRCENDL